jgi:hypothetical protein
LTAALFSTVKSGERVKILLSARTVLMGAIVCGLLSATAAPSHAHRKDFVFAKEWKQPTKGERELELYSTYSNGTLTKQIELDYGVTDRFSVAPYLVFERKPGGDLKYKEFKFESRYQLPSIKPVSFCQQFMANTSKKRMAQRNSKAFLSSLAMVKGRQPVVQPCR